MQSAAADSLEAGRDAVKRHAWTEALDAFAAADRDGGLAPDDLELMGEAAWWAGKPDRGDRSARAGVRRLRRGRPTRPKPPAWRSISPTWHSDGRRPRSVAAGWGALQGCSRACPSRGCTRGCHLFAAIGAVMDHRMTDGLALADRAIEVAREHGNADVQFMATSFKGYGEMSTRATCRRVWR